MEVKHSPGLVGRFGGFSIHDWMTIAYLPHPTLCGMTGNISAAKDFPPSAIEPCKFGDKLNVMG